MIDLHSHILPGLDDGAQTLEDSLSIARAAVAAGIGVLAATPHVSERYPTEPEAMEAALAAVREAIAREEIALDVVGGGEIALERLPGLAPDALRRFALAGTSHLLVEAPYYGWPLDIGEKVFVLQAAGFTVVLAHPERNGEVQASPARLRPLVERGLLVQLTAASVDGRLGRRPKAAAMTLLEQGLAHMLASDAHTAAVREIGMAEAARAVGDDALARWLTDDVPRALLAGERAPPRPTRRGARRRWLLF